MSIQVQRKRDVLREALKLRGSLNLGLVNPVDPLEVAEQLGIEVRIIDIGSLEGVFIRESYPVILLSSLRPKGRRCFTCAHEIGHYMLNHSTQSTESIGSTPCWNAVSQDEREAQMFAGFLLMPKMAVSNAMKIRQVSSHSITPIDAYKLACFFGVSYEGFLLHATHSLNLINDSRYETLMSRRPKQIKKDILGCGDYLDLVPVDQHWQNRPVDLETGDYMIAALNDLVVDGDNAEVVSSDPSGIVLKAIQPGISRLSTSGSSWSCHLRVCRHGYTGRSRFRYFDDPEFKEN